MVRVGLVSQPAGDHAEQALVALVEVDREAEAAGKLERD